MRVRIIFRQSNCYIVVVISSWSHSMKHEIFPTVSCFSQFKVHKYHHFSLDDKLSKDLTQVISMLITDLTHHQHFLYNSIIHQELRNKVSQLESSLKDAKEDLALTLTLIGKADKKITAAEQSVKTRREKMLGVQVTNIKTN